MNLEYEWKLPSNWKGKETDGRERLLRWACPCLNSSAMRQNRLNSVSYAGFKNMDSVLNETIHRVHFLAGQVRAIKLETKSCRISYRKLTVKYDGTKVPS